MHHSWSCASLQELHCSAARPFGQKTAGLQNSESRSWRKAASTSLQRPMEQQGTSIVASQLRKILPSNTRAVLSVTHLQLSLKAICQAFLTVCYVWIRFEFVPPSAHCTV